MKQKRIKMVGLVATLLMAVLNPTVATTYKLVKVTSVEAGKMYVFEQTLNNESRVMDNQTVSSGIGSTSSYASTGLLGNETYVWTLVAEGNSYIMKNIKENKSIHLKKNTETFLELSDTGTTPWVFTFQNDGTVYITFSYTDNGPKTRFLAYAGSTANTNFYRAYVDSQYNLSSSPHQINVYQLVEETSEDVTVTTAGMATYVSNNNLDYSGVEGLKAYKAKVNGNDITFTAVGQVPAGEGVLLKATTTLTESTVYTIPVATTSVSAWAEADNDFIRGTGEAVPSYSTEGGYYNYILNKKNGVVGFYKAADRTVAANKAYLRTTSAPSASAGAMSFSFEEGTTGIKEDGIVKREKWTADAEWYDLQGRKLSNIPTVPGLYIVNGKKVVIK